MDQRAMAEKAQNEADTSDLAVSSPPSLSTPHSRSGHSGVHHHHKFHHHGVSHHHGGSHHPGELQDFPESTVSHHSSHHRHSSHHGGAHHSRSLGLAASRDTALSHHSNDEDFVYDEHHRGSRRHHYRPRHHRGPHHAAMQPSMAHKRSRDSIWTRSRATVHPLAESSSDVHPQDNYSKTSESWADDEQFERYKTNRPPRAHKKVHSMNVCSMLWGKLCHLFDGLREMLRILTESLIFDAFIFLVVCLNIIMLVVQTFAEVEVRGEWFFVAFDSVFLCIYVVEAMLKIFTMGLDYFCDSWNNLDFFIMATAVLEFVLVQLNSRSFKHTVYSQRVFRIFKVFKSLRALRAIRILRRLSFLTSLQEVTGTLVRSMPSITAILILMFTCLFLFSVVLRALFRHSDPKRFQSIYSTIFTLFTLLTLDDWSLIYMDSLAQGAWYIIPILMVYIVIQYFIFLNLVIAVLVDNFEMALLRSQEKVMEERAAEVQETMLAESLTELSKEEPEEVISEHTKQKLFIEKKFGTMTENQQKLLFHFLQLAAGVEHYQQKFRSQASVTDEIVDAAFEAGEEDYRK